MKFQEWNVSPPVYAIRALFLLNTLWSCRSCSIKSHETLFPVFKIHSANTKLCKCCHIPYHHVFFLLSHLLNQNTVFTWALIISLPSQNTYFDKTRGFFCEKALIIKCFCGGTKSARISLRGTRSASEFGPRGT